MSSRKHNTSGSGNSSNIHVSKNLSYLLRHGAEKEGLQLQPDGFINVSTILKLPRFKNVTVQDVRSIVEADNKQRFALRLDSVSNELQIRANQGHTLKVEDLELVPITLENYVDYPEVIHGTYLKYWNSIQTKGLSRMKRQHIHCAIGKPGDSGVISGMRATAEIYIYVNLKKAIEDGLEFFRSANNVILSPGNEKGIIETKYFSSVINSKTGHIIMEHLS